MTFAPSVPVADRTSGPAAIAHEYAAGGALLESHVQSTAVPAPEPAPTTLPVASVTVTVHGSGSLSLPVKRTGPPTAPDTTGE